MATAREVLRRTGSRFLDDKLTHWAGALTYYGILSLFPALLVLVSVLGLFGDRLIDPLLEQLTDLSPGPAREIVEGALQSVRDARGSGFAFVLALAVAVWSASRYVNCFIDAANIIWDVEEERPLRERLPVRYGLTLLVLALVALTAVTLVVTGPIAAEVGRLLGIEATAVRAWDLAKWPVLLVLVGLVVGTLYRLAPNAGEPRLRWVSLGSGVAVLLWLAVSGLFAVYVSNFGSYNETYGAFGGVAVFLIWLWLTNIAILFGAALDRVCDARHHVKG